MASEIGRMSGSEARRRRSRCRAAQAPQDEVHVLHRQALELRVDLDDLRRELGAAIDERARQEAALASLDTPQRQRRRLLATSAFLAVALLVVIALVLAGGQS